MLKNDDFDKTECDKHRFMEEYRYILLIKLNLINKTKHVIFYVKDIACFAVGPSCSDDGT
jgi:hypothetical protein